jgi:hypothetical protein
MEILRESGLGEKEEGIWPTAPAPWEANFGPILDPLMLDPDDFEDAFMVGR